MGTTCVKGFVLQNGRCIDSCPAVGFYKEDGGRGDGDKCVPCYYSCKTCNGPNDYQCLSCFGDATLDQESSEGRYCYNSSLVGRMLSASRWYYVLSIGFVFNFVIVVVL